MQHSLRAQFRSDVRGLGHGGLPNTPRRGVPRAPRSLPTEVAEMVVQHAPLAYERVVGACSSINCGDMLYRRCAVVHDPIAERRRDCER